MKDATNVRDNAKLNKFEIGDEFSPQYDTIYQTFYRCIKLCTIEQEWQ